MVSHVWARRMQSELEDKLKEAYVLIETALDQSRAKAKVSSEAMFGTLRKAMSHVGELGGKDPIDVRT